MTYFYELSNGLPDYPGEDGNFRFRYNPNSGGGQSFLQGKFKSRDGELAAPITLNGKTAILKYAPRGLGHSVTPVLLNDTNVTYTITPRGAGERNMKLEVAERTNLSDALTAFFMLPSSCGARKSADLTYSVLAKQNYWFDLVLLDCEEDPSVPNTVYLIPTDVVVGGGVEKDGDASKARYFRLDFDRRIRDIISASKKAFLPASIRAPLGFFAEIYGGTRPFTFAAARQAADTLMQETAKYFPTLYSGIDDPLPLLTRLRSGRTDGPTRIETGLSSSEKRNIIVFGAPGTGKSRRLDLRKDSLLRDGGHFERVTFHPDYSYASFVGTYKPVPRPDVEGKDTITYEYVPGPFMRVLAAALINGKTENVRPHVLLIEEINRASAAAVFGDIFQLLDRDKSNVSEYPIHASADVQKCLADTVGGLPSDYEELRLPDNMFIWASMNSADQGVFPLDTAFKRRWEFEYIAIDENDNDLRGKVVTLGKDEWSHDVEWNELRKAINEFLATLGINEDKQIGPYFIRREVSVPAHGDRIETKGFVDAFQHKVLMYLFEDAARLHRKDLFDGCRLNRNRYSDVCREFEDKGVHLFHKNIVARVRSKPVKPEMSPASDDSTGVVGPGADAE